MKDAKGHGSDSRAGHKLAADYRAAHQVKLQTIPSVAQAFGSEMKRFAKDTTAGGKSALHELPDDPEKYQNVGESYAEILKGMAGGHHAHIDPSHVMHLAHFLHTMAALAVADLLVQAVAHAFGVHLV